MSEEEIIEILEDKDMFIDTLYECYRQSTVKPFEKAIQGLLDLYQAEKEKNNREVNNMKEKEDIENIFNQLTEDNKEVINMVAKGMQIAQENAEINKHVPKID